MSQSPRIQEYDGLEMPTDFPIEAHQAIRLAVHLRSPELPLWHEFSGAWNAVRDRFLAATYYSDIFKEAALTHGIGTTHRMRYEEERALFGFFASALSCMDAAYYGLYAVGAFLSPAEFALATSEQRERVKPRFTASAYERAFPGDPIAAVLRAMPTDGAFKCLRAIRNVLSHRAVPGRQIYAIAGSGARQQPDEWNLLGIPLTADSLAPFRIGLARRLGELLDAAATFVSGRF